MVRRESLELRDLEPIAVLGEGAFGMVQLVTHKVWFKKQCQHVAHASILGSYTSLGSSFSCVAWVYVRFCRRPGRLTR